MIASINGITIGYDDVGTGENVLVLVHGHPFDRSMWRSQVGISRQADFAKASTVAKAMADKSSARDAKTPRLRVIDERERFEWPSWRVIAPDLRGYGESSVIPGKTTLDVFARDIAALLDQLHIREIVMGGLSMGGQIVMEFCWRRHLRRQKRKKVSGTVRKWRIACSARGWSRMPKKSCLKWWHRETWWRYRQSPNMFVR
jgi:pimeloyl-ACP methyl ester carboxylesterase